MSVVLDKVVFVTASMSLALVLLCVLEMQSPKLTFPPPLPYTASVCSLLFGSLSATVLCSAQLGLIAWEYGLPYGFYLYLLSKHCLWLFCALRATLVAPIGCSSLRMKVIRKSPVLLGIQSIVVGLICGVVIKVHSAESGSAQKRKDATVSFPFWFPLVTVVIGDLFYGCYFTYVFASLWKRSMDRVTNSLSDDSLSEYKVQWLKHVFLAAAQFSVSIVSLLLFIAMQSFDGFVLLTVECLFANTCTAVLFAKRKKIYRSWFCPTEEDTGQRSPTRLTRMQSQLSEALFRRKNSQSAMSLGVMRIMSRDSNGLMMECSPSRTRSPLRDRRRRYSKESVATISELSPQRSARKLSPIKSPRKIRRGLLTGAALSGHSPSRRKLTHMNVTPSLTPAVEDDLFDEKKYDDFPATVPYMAAPGFTCGSAAQGGFHTDSGYLTDLSGGRVSGSVEAPPKMGAAFGGLFRDYKDVIEMPSGTQSWASVLAQRRYGIWGGSRTNSFVHVSSSDASHGSNEEFDLLGRNSITHIQGLEQLQHAYYMQAVMDQLRKFDRTQRAKESGVGGGRNLQQPLQELSEELTELSDLQQDYDYEFGYRSGEPVEVIIDDSQELGSDDLCVRQQIASISPRKRQRLASSECRCDEESSELQSAACLEMKSRPSRHCFSRRKSAEDCSEEKEEPKSSTEPKSAAVELANLKGGEKGSLLVDTSVAVDVVTSERLWLSEESKAKTAAVPTAECCAARASMSVSSGSTSKRVSSSLSHELMRVPTLPPLTPRIASVPENGQLFAVDSDAAESKSFATVLLTEDSKQGSDDSDKENETCSGERHVIALTKSVPKSLRGAKQTVGQLWSKIQEGVEDSKHLRSCSDPRYSAMPKEDFVSPSKPSSPKRSHQRGRSLSFVDKLKLNVFDVNSPVSRKETTTDSLLTAEDSIGL